MNSKERITIALKGGIPDRIPVVNIFNMNYLVQEFKIRGKTFKSFNQENLKQIIDFQEEMGHDPVYYLCTFHEPGVVKLEQSFMEWKAEDQKDWNVEEKIVNKNGEKIIERFYHTPKGNMKAVFKREKYQAWIKKHSLENKDDISLLKCRPEPEKMDLSILKNIIKDLGNRGFLTIGVPSVWEEACALRGMEKMIYDVFDDPIWVKEFFTLLMQYSIKIAKVLGRAKVDSIFVDESYVGMGMSRDMYREFILPYDSKIIEAANSEGMVTSLHNCGKCNALLEDMAESGAVCIETLASGDYSGDVDLKDASQRVGDRVGIWGGFKERVLAQDKQFIKEEVLRCFNAASQKGGYILRGIGQVYEAKFDNLKYLRELAEEYGSH